MNSQFTQMASTPNHEVILSKFYFSDTYSLTLKGMNNGIKFEITEQGDTPEEATDKVHAKWLHLTNRVPELLTALPAPNYGTYTVVSDDELPF